MKHTMRLELKEKDLGDVSVGDIVTVKVTGKVRSVDAGEPPEKSKGKLVYDGMPPSMRLEVQDVEIDVTNDFGELAEDD